MSRNLNSREHRVAAWLGSDMGRQLQAAVLAAMTVAGLLLAVRWALAESNFAMGLGGFVGVLFAVAWWHAACRGLLNPTPVASFLMLAQATAWGAALTLAAPGPLSLAPLLLLGGIEAVWRLTSSHGGAAHLAASEASEATSDGSHAAAAAEENSLFVAQATDAPSRDWRDVEAETLNEHWTQIQTRGGDGDSEYIRVQQRVTISAGQRLAVFHVGFCPPLAAEPSLEFEQVGGPEARLRITELRSVGARVEVRLARAEDEDAIVEVEGYAATAGRQESAA